MASGDTRTNQYLDVAANGTRADLPSETCCETRTQTLIRGVAERIMDVEEEVEQLENNPDVVDIVDTYADLQDYDTSGLTDKDIIRVITDETKGGLSSYYRWNSPNPGWNFVGVVPGGDGIKELSSADYNYPTNDPDRVALWLLDNGVYTAPAGVMVAASTTSYPWYNTSDKTILVGGSDTVKGIYTFLNGKTDVVTTQVSDGTEADEYTLLKSAQVLQATGQSTTDTMSQKAITDAIAGAGGGVTELTSADYNWPTTGTATSVALWLLPAGLYHWQDGVSVNSSANKSVVNYGFREALVTPVRGENVGILLIATASNTPIYASTNITTGAEVDWITLLGYDRIKQETGFSTANLMSQNAITSMVYADPSTKNKVRIGSGANVYNYGIAIGNSAYSGAGYSVALGDFSRAMQWGQFDISTGSQATSGYNSSNYRLLTGLYDPQSAHDAATKGYVDGLVGDVASALNVINNGGNS